MSRGRIAVAAAVGVVALVLLGVGLRVLPAERPPTTAASPTPGPGPTGTPSAGPGGSAVPTSPTAPSSSPAPTSNAEPSPTTPTEPSPISPTEPSPDPSATPNSSATPDPGLIDVAEAPCPNDVARGWECITLTVPLDHFAAGDATHDVTFALRRHTGPGRARGVFVTATGGPGTSGISSAVGYTSVFDRQIRDQFDIVFFDQRGIGRSGPALQCPNATLVWYTDTSQPEDSTATTGLAAGAQVYAEDCVAEMEQSGIDPATLPYFGTNQAVEDLEAFRTWFGADQLYLYGESYGTQYVQTYAAAHPDRVRMLLVDGPVDLELTGPEFWLEGAREFDRVVEATLYDCSTQDACTADVSGGEALKEYDDLAAQLEEAPIEYTYTMADGTQEQREFTATDLENATAGYAYEGFDRMLFQRAVATGSRDDVWWLARQAYLSLGQHPDTLEAIPDETYSDAMFYAVECQDYGYFSGSPEERAQAYLDYGREAGIDSTRVAADYYGDLPCVFWPGTESAPAMDERPAGLVDTPYPMVVMGSTLDPATPWANAERIFERNAANAWSIVTPGGPHIIFGRGDACPDDLVTAMLVEDEFPEERHTVCPGDVADDYFGIPRHSLDDYTRDLEALSDVDDEINYSSDYWIWDYEDPLTYGCPFGGTITYTPIGVGSRVELDGCGFWEGDPLTGEGTINDNTGEFDLEVEGVDGPVVYARDAEGERTVSGVLLEE